MTGNSSDAVADESLVMQRFLLMPPVMVVLPLVPVLVAFLVVKQLSMPKRDEDEADENEKIGKSGCCPIGKDE